MGNVYSYLMGNIWGYQTDLDNIHDNIHDNVRNNTLEKAEELKTKLDIDGDRIITKNELDKYFELLSVKIDENSDGKIDKLELEKYVDEKLNFSKSEIEKWKTAYNKLEIEYNRLMDMIKRNEQHSNIEEHDSYISVNTIKKYIKEEVMDTDANLKYVPDPLEKKIYLIVYKTLMKTLENLFNTTGVDFIGHRISIKIVPQ